MRCSKLDTCRKVQMVLDKSFDAPDLYVKLVAEVCKKCGEAQEVRRG